MHKRVIKKKKITLNPKKVKISEGIKLTQPLEITVSLVQEMGELYDICLEGHPFLRDRKLVGLGGLERTQRTYEKILRKIKHEDYDLQSNFEIKFSLEY
ncbi:MAG: hypothetical protein KKC19_03365 [Nanoarchaeota archaeon]|nr:hypothetical protein [Nanoarchaeota archaeon]